MRKLKLFLSLLMLFTFSVGSVWGYTITFKDNGTSSDSSTKRTTIDDIISDGASYVQSLSNVSNVYNARSGRGLKLGAKSSTGGLTLNLKEAVTVTSIVVRAMRYSESETTLKIQNKTDYTLTAALDDYTYTYSSPTSISSITIGSTSKRNYIVSVTVNTGSAEPTVFLASVLV